jgi:hypothetical protein
MGNRIKWGYRFIALLIAGAFIYVQSTALTCSISHLIDQSGVPHQHPLGHDHHHGSHADGEEPADDHHDSGGHDEEQESCCSDFTNAFLSAFGKSQAHTTEGICKAVADGFAVALPFSIMPVGFVKSSAYSREYFHPPPRVPDIRMFIRSFQV